MSIWRRRTAFLKTPSAAGWGLFDGERATLAEIGRRLARRTAAGPKQEFVISLNRRRLDADGSFNNYYIARANALEENVVPCKVENGIRLSIAPKGLPRDLMA
jgi:hypothetical protein